ncbi:4'-phosphopantetheinyl transferase family protein [Arthrobacter stackebrandtii]|nr:4'-phosphopantetheinyl transferase superfamily protein [Arthrobacter stackebrandtii]PYG99423.1 hypothetical protein CVV67_14975 [Arthrobacter stackebrandtii]
MDAAWLSEGERACIAAKRLPADRARSAAARILLKRLLAAEFGIDPGTVQLLAAGGRGTRPELAWVRQPGGPPGLSANVSHAGDVVVVAVARGGMVGVDVEQHCATGFDGFDQVALSVPERDLVAGTLPALQPQLRTDLWVRKEAALKAVGEGLRRDPAELCFAGSVLGSRAVNVHSGVAVQLLEAAVECSAAVAVVGASSLRCHEIPEPSAPANNYAIKTWPFRELGKAMLSFSTASAARPALETSGQFRPHAYPAPSTEETQL